MIWITHVVHEEHGRTPLLARNIQKLFMAGDLTSVPIFRAAIPHQRYKPIERITPLAAVTILRASSDWIPFRITDLIQTFSHIHVLVIQQ